MSQDKIRKKTKCETLVDLVLNTKIHFSLVIPIPFLARKHHLETFESRTARALAPLCSYIACFNAKYRLLPVMTLIELHALIALLKSSYMVVSMSPHKLCFYHLPTRGRAGIKLGDV